MAASFSARVLGFAGAVLSATLAFAGVQYDRMIVFGDSLSDTGNVLFNTTGSSFVTARPTTPYYDNGRWTNGSALNGQAGLNLAHSAYTGVWHEVLADRLGVARARPVLGANGTNYAYGGATTANSSGTYTNNIGFQVQNQYLGNNPNWDSHHIYCIWGGGNDIRHAGNSILWRSEEHT